MICPNCKAAVMSGETHENRMYDVDCPGTQLMCHNCNAEYIIDGIEVRLKAI